MALVLSEGWSKHAKISGSDTFELAAGNKVRVQTWDPVNGIVDILGETPVPADKSWTVNVFMDIQETDV